MEDELRRSLKKDLAPILFRGLFSVGKTVATSLSPWGAAINLVDSVIGLFRARIEYDTARLNNDTERQKRLPASYSEQTPSESDKVSGNSSKVQVRNAVTNSNAAVVSSDMATLRKIDAEIIDASRLQRELELTQAYLLERANEPENSQHISSDLSGYLTPGVIKGARNAAERHGILCFPNFVSDAPEGKLALKYRGQFYKGMSSIIGYANTLNGYDNLEHSQYTSQRNERIAPPLILNTELLAPPHPSLSDTTVEKLHGLLKGFAVVCIQISWRSDNAMLDAWWWLQGDETPMSISLPLPAHDPLQELETDQLWTSLAQFLLILLCDALSICGFEGVSMLSWTLGSLSVSRDQLTALYALLEPWYEEMRARSWDRYGDPTVIGALLTPALPDDELLKILRMSAHAASYDAAREGGMAGEWLFQAISPLKLPDRAYVLALLPSKGKPEDHATVRYLAFHCADSSHLSEQQWRFITQQGMQIFQRNPQAYIEIGVDVDLKDEIPQILRFNEVLQ